METEDVRRMTTIQLPDRSITIYRPLNDDSEEAYFESEVVKKIQILESLYPSKYNPVIHDAMVIQLVKSEMLIESYEYLILNRKETEMVIKLLKMERENRNFLYSELAISLKGMAKIKLSNEKEGITSLFDLKASESD